SWNRATGKRNNWKFLGRSYAGEFVGSATFLRLDCAVFCVPGNDPEFEAVRYHTTFGSTDGASDRRGRKNNAAENYNASDRTGTGGVARSHQDAGHQWRRFFQRQQRASLRKSESAN